MLAVTNCLAVLSSLDGVRAFSRRQTLASQVSRRQVPATALDLPQHPDEHRPQRPVLLAVDQQLGEGATLWVAPELADPVGSLEVGQHQDVEQFGAGSGAEGVEASPQPALELIGSHGWKATPDTPFDGPGLKGWLGWELNLGGQREALGCSGDRGDAILLVGKFPIVGLADDRPGLQREGAQPCVRHAKIRSVPHGHSPFATM